jgi:hypothetical protein
MMVNERRPEMPREQHRRNITSKDIQRPKTFISDDSADPANYPVWIRRGERLGDAILSIKKWFVSFGASRIIGWTNPSARSQSKERLVVFSIFLLQNLLG